MEASFSGGAITSNGGELANAYVGTIWLKLLKIDTIVSRNTRPAAVAVRFLPPSGVVPRRRSQPAARRRTGQSALNEIQR